MLPECLMLQLRKYTVTGRKSVSLMLKSQCLGGRIGGKETRFIQRQALRK
jgi:hypothetical protein